MNPGYVLSDEPHLHMEITIDNAKKQNINKIKYQFVQNCETELYHRRTVLLDSMIDGISDCTEEHLHGKLVVPIPRSVLELPPTYSHINESNPMKSILVFYTLKIECCVDGFFGVFTNIKFQMPIFVASKQ